MLTTGTRPPLRRRRDVTAAAAVTLDHHATTRPITLARPTRAAIPLLAWLSANVDQVRNELYRSGAILFRGFSDGKVAVRAATELVAGEPAADYRDAATPRRKLAAGIYTSTEYPADQHIELHNEACYADRWPLVLGFACDVAPATGGRTPLASTRQLWRRVPHGVRARLEHQGVRYVRNFTPGLGIRWRDAIDVPPEHVIAHCAAHGISARWLDDEHLRTVATRPAAVRHPVTGEWAWFNQVTGFHLTTLGADLASELVAQVGADRVPKTTSYGDGADFSDADLRAIRRVVAEETVTFDWEVGDLLLIDNILMAHGREPFTGSRRLAVAMAGTGQWSHVESLPRGTV